MNESKPRSQDQEPLSRRERVDRAGDEFERRFRAGEGPRIENYLVQAEEGDREPLLRELIALELALHEEAGQAAELDEYRRRFVGDGSIVDAALASFQQRRQADPSLHSTEDMQHDESQGQDPCAGDAMAEQDVPDKIGRFEVLRVLGRGGFGIVYLARDPDLDREVALKVPRLERFNSEAAFEMFVDEARKAAKLEHPGIVRVLEVQREPGLVYIVQQYLPGGDLAQHAKSNRLPPQRVAELMTGIAEAVGHAHQQRYTHLDLKPANILLDAEGNPHVADFGLALHETTQSDKAGAILGTYAYMSPEQVRGEAHRLDGRSDIWSLGVILYELLVGGRPFTGKSRQQLVDEIQHRDPRPPRQVNPESPRELSRICLACLAKRATDRYQATADLIDDLRHWLEDKPREAVPADAGEPAAVETTPLAKIIPQGLRSFGPEHADFYLELLEGPHDREGLPPGVRFWKTQIEQADPDETFSVGVLYGPSGCGKSSLMKAGVLPRLDKDDVLPIYIEATAADTEVRLLKALKKHCPELPADADLTDLVARLRSQGGSRGRKVLIVLDQFEQWLHAHEARADSQLRPALRQCDGAGVQCLVMVRDDFWMSLTRFMDALEVPIVQGHNAAAVDLFHADHARNVLLAFGRAYEKLPESLAEPDAEQQQFLEQAVDGLADEGKVICVRLAVFAEMMKSRPWTPASLKDVGGAEGVGVTFLEETFSAKTAPMAHRQHEKAVRAVLKAMLPSQGTDIKAEMNSYDALLEASGCQHRADFDALLEVLDSGVRLITPTEPDEQTSRDAAAVHGRYYQLTHDFLVPSLRDWLTRKQKETRRGRAELQLNERAVMWGAKPVNRHLPHIMEWLRLQCLTDSSRWGGLERAMMRKAAKTHVMFMAAAFLGVFTLAASIWIYTYDLKRRSNQSVARGYVEQLAATTPDGVPAFVKLVQTRKEHVIPLLRRITEDDAQTERARLHAACALLQLGLSDFSFPWSALKTCDPGECRNIVSALTVAPPQLVDDLSEAFSRAAQTKTSAFRARLAIVLLYLGRSRPAQEMLRIRGQADRKARTAFEVEFTSWHASLSELAGIMEHVEDPALRSGICCALGNADHSSESAPEAQARTARWKPVLDSWHSDATDAATRSSAGWLLRLWGLPSPKASHRASDGWRETSLGLTMVRLPQAAGSDAELDLWASDREITVGLFRQMMEDASYRAEFPDEFPHGWSGEDEAISPNPEHPVQSTTWYEAVMFCNWLSRKEGQTPYYELTGEKEEVFGERFSAWRPVVGSKGFRLPTEREWERACNANAGTNYWFGDDASLLARYAVYSVNSGIKTAPVASKPCNDGGLFDMHGNVAEWCEDPFSTETRVCKGGSWFSTSVKCMTAERQGNGPGYRGSYLGLRVFQSRDRAQH